MVAQIAVEMVGSMAGWLDGKWDLRPAVMWAVLLAEWKVVLWAGE
jgi:hypothetical protein